MRRLRQNGCLHLRSLEELVDVEDPAWPILEAAIAGAAYPVVVVPAEPERCVTTLLRLQVTVRSPLGALAFNTGGLLIDHGWLRVLGGGEPPLNLALANGLDVTPEAPPARLLVAFDVLGGRYEVNGGALPADPGEVCYFAPDSLQWERMGFGHADFVLWSLSDRLALFNEHLRWPGWETEVAALSLADGISLYPPPFTTDGEDISQVSRRPVPIAELLTYWEDAGQQLADVADGQQFSVNVVDEEPTTP